MDNDNKENFSQTWWKWGDSNKSFHLSDYPKLKRFLENKWEKTLIEDFNLSEDDQLIEISTFTLNDFQDYYQQLEKSQFSNENLDRLKYGFGKGYQDALNILTNKNLIVPDFVLYPESEKDVSHILKQSEENGVAIMTFSGGTNVTECFSIEGNRKWVCALNMQRMNKVLEIDDISLTATFECGIYGPKLEKCLNDKGFTMGHFPQSFEFSTLGGWIATRSAGQESGKYGKIEDMILGLKAVTPNNTIENRDYPKHAMGIDVFPLFVGSEGTLGVIVQAKMKIHQLPQSNNWVVALFKDFESGSKALRTMVQSGKHPAICRLSDHSETKMLSLLSNSEPNGLKKHFQNFMKSYLSKKGYDKPCMLMLKFIYNHTNYTTDIKQVKKLLKANDATILPAYVSTNWEDKRFSLPYLRETLIQHRILIDMFETSTYWKNLMPLYSNIKNALDQKSDYFRNGGIIFCHISHIYNTGASLYFTLMTSQEKGNELQQWNNIKEIVTSAIYDGGGAISHHHGIGKAHRKWYNQQLNIDERSLMQAIKSYLDPNDILNPGKLFDET
ncbi:MAG: FAD-binding oxidoreductase [Candidatus Marinimicrobia bacterium]|jgi:alkyldihydroxyacetonephosphate synthase|nr:FAD-binding oxidoreductase [Candidatus Neomarinimicrobiota bacterium]